MWLQVVMSNQIWTGERVIHSGHFTIDNLNNLIKRYNSSFRKAFESKTIIYYEYEKTLSLLFDDWDSCIEFVFESENERDNFIYESKEILRHIYRNFTNKSLMDKEDYQRGEEEYIALMQDTD